MAYENTIRRITNELNSVFDALNAYFDLSHDIRRFHIAPEAWSIDEILEHITLTNHFLMLTLGRNAKVALRRARTQAVTGEDSDLDLIVCIGDPDAFAWARPEHMEPTRQVTPDQVRVRLHEQRRECLTILDSVRHGEGSLHTVRMSVQNLGRFDVYQWLYFLVQHAKRHTVEIERIRDAYLVHQP